MNKVMLMGRLTRDPELKNTQSNVPCCDFTLAVDRRFKNANGEREADFISCQAWRQTAELIAQYLSKGDKIAVVGSIRTSSWEDKDGRRNYRTDVVVDEMYFAESKRTASHPQYDRAEPKQHAKKYSDKKHQPNYTQDFLQSPDDAAILPFDF